jgi:hypothetical protein
MSHRCRVANGTCVPRLYSDSCMTVSAISMVVHRPYRPQVYDHWPTLTSCNRGFRQLCAASCTARSMHFEAYSDQQPFILLFGKLHHPQSVGVSITTLRHLEFPNSL